MQLQGGVLHNGLHMMLPVAECLTLLEAAGFQGRSKMAWFHALPVLTYLTVNHGMSSRYDFLGGCEATLFHDGCA